MSEKANSDKNSKRGKKPEKVLIQLRKIKTKSDEYISVFYNALGYAGSIPCHDENQIKEAIEDCKRWIKREGDIPVVNGELGDG